MAEKVVATEVAVELVAQFKLFTQLYPNNARPVQPVNGRPVREAQ